MAQVILLQPSVGDMDKLRDAPHLPLGLLCAASGVAGEFRTALVDQRLDADWRSELEAALEEDTICVAVTSMSGTQIGFALEMASHAKKLTRAPVVWGGVHATLLPEQVLQDERADIVVRGEGEVTFLELVRRLRQGASLLGLESVSFKDSCGRIVHNKSRSLSSTLDELPEPAWDLVDLDLYRPKFLGRRTLNIETSRGCSRRCAYCYNQAAGKTRLRSLSPERALGRIVFLNREKGVDSFYLVDDNLFLNKKNALELASGLVGSETDVRWQSQGMDIVTILSMKESELDLLVRSGLNRIAVGADSGSDRILKFLNKAYCVEDIVEANRKLARFPIVVYYSFLSGLPGEADEDLDATLDLMLRLTEENGLARTSPVYNYLPLPGTKLWKSLIRDYGFEPPARLEDWVGVDYANVNVCHLNEAMAEKLERGYFPTLFLDRKFDEYGSPWWVKVLADLYRPVARERVRRKFFSLQPESLVGRYLRSRWSA